MINKNINICYAVDSNYVPHMCCSMASILSNANPNDVYNFYILENGIPQKDKHNIESLKNTIRGFNITYFCVKNEDFESCPITGYVNYITKATYYRFKIPELLRNIDKVLYLDCDTIIMSDISELYDIDLEDNYIAAIPEPYNQLHRERLEIKGENYYCNAGVILMNLSKIRSNGIDKIFFKYSENPTHKIIYQDQDIINEVAKYHIKYLPLKWNLQHDAFFDCNSYPYHKEERCNAISSPKLIHFTNKYKPWHYRCKNPDKKQYLKYLKKTSYKYLFLKIFIFKTISHFISQIYSKKEENRTKTIKFLGIKIRRTDRIARINDVLFNIKNILFDTQNDIAQLKDKISHMSHLDQRTWYMHECVKSIFRYQTGLEFDDDCRPERFIVFDPAKAPLDHRKRYLFALNEISAEDTLLDAACGTRYGAFLLASKCKSVIGIDINAPAIAFANKIFKAQNLKFDVADLLNLEISKYPQFDTIVSFETIEHVSNSEKLIQIFRSMLKPGGKFICSVPNENTIPFSKNTHPFHMRHFTPEQITNILEKNSFGDIQIYYQYNNKCYNIEKSETEGEDIIIIAKAI